MGKRATLALMVVAFCALDLLVHWLPAFRETWSVSPSELGGDTNEFVTLWIAEFSRTVRSLPFARTGYFLNVWGNGQLYSTHPGLLTFLAAIWQNLFGEAPAALRRLAILLFVIRLGLLHSLTRDWIGARAAGLAVLLYLALPTTQTYAHALSFEVVSGTFVLAAFAAWPRRYWLACLCFSAAVATDWTALFALPFFAWRSPSRVLPAAITTFALTYGWAFHYSGSSELAYFSVRLYGQLYAFAQFPPALIAQRLYHAFPLFLLAPFAYDIVHHGLRGRPPWWWGTLTAGTLLIACFLEIFIIHSYLSELLALALVAAAARGWLELSRRRPKLMALGAALAFLEAAHGFDYPWQSRAEGELRLAHAREGAQARAVIGRHSYLTLDDERYLRPSLWQLYWPGAPRVWEGCSDLVVKTRESGLACARPLFAGSLFCVEKAPECPTPP